MTKSTFSLYDRLTVYAGCAVLIILSLVFFRERVTFSDSAAYVVHIMSRNSYEIAMKSRFIGGLTQVLPITAFRCHASLHSILLLYSLNSMLIPVTCALLAMHWFRETKTAWSIILFMTLMATWTFYYPVSEFQSGLCILLFYAGACSYFEAKGKVNTLPFILLSLLLVPTVIFCHPLAMPVFASWLLLKLVVDKSNWRSLVPATVIAIIAYIIKRLFFYIEYEDKKADALDHFLNFSTHDLTEQLSKDFFKALLQDYFLLPLIGAGILLVLIRRKQVAAAVFFLLVVIGWWLLVTVSFLDVHYDHYYEHMYQAIPLFLAMYGCTLLLPALKPQAGRLLLLLVFALSVSRIVSAAKFHQDRFAWFERCFRLMDRMHCKKAAFHVMSPPGGMDCPSSWSIPYETLLLSTLQGKAAGKSILITGNIEDVKKEPRQVYDIDTIDAFPLTPAAYFDINSYPWCTPEDQLTEKQVTDIMYGQ